MSNVCPECSFEAKNPQGLGNHRAIKHFVASKVAQKQTRIVAQAHSVALATIDQKLAEHRAFVEGVLAQFSQKLEDSVKAIRSSNDQMMEKVNSLISGENEAEARETKKKDVFHLDELG